MGLEGLLDETEAANELGVTRGTLANWRWRHYGPPFLRVGRRVQYLAADINDWQMAQRLDPASDGTGMAGVREGPEEPATSALRRASRDAEATKPSTELWSGQEVCDYLRIPPATLRYWAWQKIGPRSYKLGRYRKYKSADVRVWAARQADEPEDEPVEEARSASR